MIPFELNHLSEHIMVRISFNNVECYIYYFIHIILQ